MADDTRAAADAKAIIDLDRLVLQLRARVQELERVLPYIQHLPDCPRARDEDAPCECGLWAIPGQPHAGN